ncbi:MAG: DUF4143 domain-containing protein [Acidimicrobiaceae bacterium]|nr:DUF4143 domain-containing protein [Acidimicrobiaceae bacterium]MCY4280009.1 DUF4143 domain-containing protein [Acidimicrobiaceae bacterium]
MSSYLPRLLDPLLDSYLDQLPALMVVGPRSCGKATTAERHARTTIRLDHHAEAAAVTPDVDAALRNRDEPILLDEWQRLPSVMWAVKRAVDAERRPGRFLITGSAGLETKSQLWPGTGRVVMLPMYPLTVAEQQQTGTQPFIDRVVAGELLDRASGATLDVHAYLRLALRSGFPEPALQLDETTARAWLESYADQVALRDAQGYDKVADAARLRSYLEAYALNSAGSPHHKTIYDAAGIARDTALAYERRLSELLVVHQLPAWSSNRLKRLSRSPKRFVVDAGLLCGILRVGFDEVAASSDLAGRTLETFVVSQLLAEAAVAGSRYRLMHLRGPNGRHEIDVMAEFGGGRLVGIEIKAAAGAGAHDARHLAWLRDSMPDAFEAGVVLHTGEHTYRLSDRIVAAPISTLWAPSASKPQQVP